MNGKITIIGAGAVGSTVGYLLVEQGLASEILFIDVNKDKAIGEALDIYQATPFLNSCKVYAGEYEDAKDSEIVIITSGVARKPGQSRIDLAQTNINIIKSIAPSIVKNAPNALYIIVANPVDVLTYTFCKVSGLPENRVIGSGTSLDTSRLRTRLSEFYNVSPLQVEANVFGEHGDSSFIPWSLVRIAGVPIKEYRKALSVENKNIPNYDEEEVANYVRKSGGDIISKKGATFYGIAAAVAYICKCVLSGTDHIVCCSTMLNGEYGINDVCISIPVVIGSKGVVSRISPTLTNEEIEKFENTCNKIKDVISQVNCNK